MIVSERFVSNSINFTGKGGFCVAPGGGTPGRGKGFWDLEYACGLGLRILIQHDGKGGVMGSKQKSTPSGKGKGSWGL